MDLLGSSAIVETAIGLALVFFLGAGVCTAVVELVASLFAFRSKLLWRGVARWFSSGADLADTRRGLTKALSLLTGDVGTTEGRTPSWVRRWRKVAAAVQKLPFVGRAPDTTTSETSEDRKRFLMALPGVENDARALKRTKSLNRDAAVTAIDAVTRLSLDAAPHQLAKLLAKLPDEIKDSAEKRVRWIEQWFDDEMARVEQAYRARIRWYAGFVGLVLVFVMGLDAIHLGTELYREPARRQVLTAAAEDEAAGAGSSCEVTPEEEPDATERARQRFDCTQDLIGELDGLDVSRWNDGPGWPSGIPKSVGDRLVMVLGMGAMVGALAAGAPWWFSILKRLMGLRKGAKGDV